MRLIDADETIRIWDGCEITGSIAPIVNARPTVDAIPISWIADYEAKIVQNLVKIVQSKDFDDDEFHTQICMLLAVVELQTTWAERKEE